MNQTHSTLTKALLTVFALEEAALPVSAQSYRPCAVLNATTPESLVDKTPDPIAQKLERLLTEAKFSGSFLAMREGKIILTDGFGFTDPEKKIPNNACTLYDVGSLSKVVTAIAVLLLEHHGLLSTDDLIQDHFPAVAIPDTYKGVTIYHLLTHTSGLPGQALASGNDIEKIVGDTFSIPASFHPGTGYTYSNSGYALLALIVEKVSGTSFENFCRENIFKPAGMTDTGFCGESFDPDMLAHGLIADFGKHRLPTPDPYPPSNEFGAEYKGMGGVISNVAELRNFILWAFGEGLPNEVKLKLTTPSSVNPNYACGLEVLRLGSDAVCYGHTGNVAGFSATLLWCPKGEILLISASNEEKINWPLVRSVMGTLLGRK